MPTENSTIQASLDRARRRAAEAAPGSPEWDAAMDEIDDLVQRLEELQRTSSEPAA